MSEHGHCSTQKDQVRAFASGSEADVAGASGSGWENKIMHAKTSTFVRLKRNKHLEWGWSMMGRCLQQEKWGKYIQHWTKICNSRTCVIKIGPGLVVAAAAVVVLQAALSYQPPVCIQTRKNFPSNGGFKLNGGSQPPFSDSVILLRNPSQKMVAYLFNEWSPGRENS